MNLNEARQSEEKKKPTYLSQSGFVRGRILRGKSEIEPLMEILQELNVEFCICGGYVRYMCSTHESPTKAKDVDVYFYSQKDFDVAEKHMKEEWNMDVRHENAMSLTFQKVKNHDHPFFACSTIQLIKPIKEGRVVSVGDIETVLENFDFTVVRCGISKDWQVLVDADFLHDEPKKILRIKNIHCPIGSTLRCMKYSRKGYWLPPTQALSLFLDWDSRDEEYREKLKTFLQKTHDGEGLTQTQIDELEAMMRID